MKGLRITCSVLCATACLLLGAFWIRSCWQIDQIVLPITSSSCLSIGSMPGCCGGGIVPISSVQRGMPPPFWDSGSTAEWLSIPKSSRPYDPSRLLGAFFANGEGVVVPYWFAIFIFASVGVTPWIRWSKRFSLLTVLIGMTIVAVLLGLIVATINR
jgi:hypothetical protein